VKRVLALIITTDVILFCMQKADGTLIPKNVTIAGEKYTAYKITDPYGQELKLTIKKDDDKAERIKYTYVQSQEDYDDTVQWYCTSESGSEHIYRTCIVSPTSAPVLSSREWVWIEGKYEPVAEDYAVFLLYIKKRLRRLQ
jgi:hypothetical protein